MPSISDRRMRAFERKDVSPPRVLLIGGEEYRAVMDEIAEHPLLQREPYVSFINAVVPGADLAAAVDSADALIFMPDFTRSAQPGSYASVVRGARDQSVPIARFYPKTFSGVKATDVHTIPFDTPAGIVAYAAEFLLARAVGRGRYVDGRLAVSQRLNTAALATVVVLLVWIAQMRGELKLNRRILTIPEPTQQELVVAIADLRKDSFLGAGRTGQAGLKTYYSRWASIVANTMDAAGGSLRRLTTDPSEQGRPNWSRDGASLYYYSTGNPMQIWRMAAAGGPGVQVTTNGGHAGQESLDGKDLLYDKVYELGVFRRPLGGGEEAIFLEKAKPGWWAPTTKGIYFAEVARWGGQVLAPPVPIRLWDYRTGKISAVATIEKPIFMQNIGLSASLDGMVLVWEQIDQQDSDLMLVDNFR